MTDTPATADAGPRLRYDDGCGLAHALNLIGDRWALLVVRELLLTPKRFQQLRAGLPGVSAAVLSGRVRQMSAAGLLTHDADTGRYALTEHGAALRPVVLELARWGVGRLGHDPRRHLSPTAVMLSMEFMHRPTPDAQAGREVGVVMGREAFDVRIGGGGLTVEPVADPGAAVVVHGTANAIAAMLYGGAPVDHHRAQGTVRCAGDVDALQRFVDQFGVVALPA